MKKIIKGLSVGLCCLCMNIQAQTSGTCGDSAYWEYSNDTLRIYGSGAIWNMYGYGENQPWKEIRKDIKYLIIDEGITEIGYNAFFALTQLKSVSLPESLKTIIMGSFQITSELQSITFPKNVTHIGAFAFSSGCDKLKTMRNKNTTPQPMYYNGGRNCFYGIYPSDMILYVPKESIELYKSAEGWKDFGAIIDDEHFVGDIILQAKDRECNRGDAVKLVDYSYTNNNYYNIRFSSNNPEVVSVDTTGLIRCFKGDTAIITLSSGNNRITNKIKITVRKESNSRLKSLETNFEFEPKFSAECKDYWMTVNSDVSKIEFTATPEDEYAKVSSTSTNLKDGENTVKITVRAEDENYYTEYAIHTYRKSKEARLKSMVINQGSLEPGFKPDTKEYIWRITKKDPYLKISTVPMHDKAIAEEIKNSFKGDTSFLILTTAEDNRYGEKYTVKVEAYEDNAHLKDLKVEEFELKPEFQPHISKYDVTVPNDTRNVKVVAVPEDPNATVSGQTGWIQITGAEMLFTINVLAEDRISHRAYQIKIRKEALATAIEKVEDFYDERVAIYTVDGRYLGVTEKVNNKIKAPNWLIKGTFIAVGSKYREKFTN